MRTIKQILIVALVLVLAAQIATTIYDNSAERRDPPVIHCDGEILKISASASEAELIQGITASDNQDGDLTNQVLIGNVSHLISSDTAKVTYLVFDSDRNMASFVRKVQYTDYEKPRFFINHREPLVWVDVDDADLLSRIYATDVIEGDISNRIRVSAMAQTDEDERIHDVTVQVTNSMGDTSWLTLPVLELPFDNTNVTLNCYLLYLEQGSEFNAMDYFSSATTADGQMLPVEQVQVSGTVDTSTAGEYRITYTCGSDGIAILTVVVK